MPIQQQALEFDSPWKDILELYFQPFIEFFLPALYTQIDWSKGYEFLDKELQKVVRDAITRSRRVDKLIKVWLNTGKITILYIHLEVQGQVKTDFAERMFIYHYRLYDRYGAQVMSVAILGDDQPKWRPQSYEYKHFGCSLSFEFPIIKLLDYQQQWAQLSNHPNPFALVIQVHLKGLETQHQPRERYRWKIELYQNLYKAHYTKKEIFALFRFLDWVLTLPEPLEQNFTQFTHNYEEEKNMKYLTSVERFALQKGLEQGIKEGQEQGVKQGVKQGNLQQAQEAVITVLRVRFPRLPKKLVSQIKQIEQPTLLSELLKLAVVESLDSFKQHLNNPPL